ncbi:MAG: 30S ribosomal protein S6 [Elusimicrobia bacterium]|nr:30S ribosomal protein S6 [Elusimicrobiota bacterium]
MPNYETVFILKPNLSSEKVDTVLTKTKGIITSNEGTIILSDSWGKRRLAYPVKKYKEGSYYLFHFSCDGKIVAELENFFRTSDSVIKYITIKLDKSLKKKTESKKEEKPAETDIKNEDN